MHTATYMSEAGELEEKKFETLGEARAFFKELATKSIPMKKFEDFSPKKMKTRLEELEELIRDVHSSMTTPEAIRAEMLISLEIERHDILMKS